MNKLKDSDKGSPYKLAKGSRSRSMPNGGSDQFRQFRSQTSP